MDARHEGCVLLVRPKITMPLTWLKSFCAASLCDTKASIIFSSVKITFPILLLVERCCSVDGEGVFSMNASSWRWSSRGV